MLRGKIRNYLCRYNQLNIEYRGIEYWNEPWIVIRGSERQIFRIDYKKI